MPVLNPALPHLIYGSVAQSQQSDSGLRAFRPLKPRMRGTCDPPLPPFMPYIIKKQGDQYLKVRKDTGKVVSRHASRQKAVGSIIAEIEHTGEDVKSQPDPKKQ